MLEEGMTLKTMQRVDSQINEEYETRHAKGAHEMLASTTPEEIKSLVRELGKNFDGTSILSSVQTLSLFARSSTDPKAILAAIEHDAEDFAKESPTESHDGTWRDVKKARELTQDSPLGNVTYLLWEKTARKYKETHGEMPRTDEEKRRLEEAKERTQKTKVS